MRLRSLLLVCGITCAAIAQDAPHTNLKAGDTAPDFTLASTSGKSVKLSDFRGKENVVLAFVVKAFTGG